MNSNNYYVYMHVFPNDKIYVGITSKEPEKRWLKDGYGYRNQQVVYSAIKKYGWNNIQHIVIARNISYESAKNIEIDLISLYDTTNRKNGYNISPGGDLISEESRKKISMSHIGKRPSEEARRKMSESRRGKKKSEEHRRKIGESNRGRIVSEETRKKISDKAKGRKHDTENDPRNIPILQYDIDTGTLIGRYISFAEAARQTGASRPHINECAKDKRRQEIGCIWIYESEATEEYIRYRLHKASMHNLYKPIAISQDSSFSKALYAETVSMAAKFTGSSEILVINAIRNKRPYHGYYFKRISIDEYLDVLNS